MKRILVLLSILFISTSPVLASRSGTLLKGGNGAGNGGGIGGDKGQDGGLLYIKVLGKYDGTDGYINVSGENGKAGGNAYRSGTDLGAYNNSITSDGSGNLGNTVLYTNSDSSRVRVYGTITATTTQDAVLNYQLNLGPQELESLMNATGMAHNIDTVLMPGETISVSQLDSRINAEISFAISINRVRTSASAAGGGGGGSGGHGGKIVIRYNNLESHGTYEFLAGKGGEGGKALGDGIDGIGGQNGNIGSQDISLQLMPRLQEEGVTGIAAREDITDKVGLGYYAGRLQSRGNYVLFEKDHDEDGDAEIYLQNFFELID